MVCQSCSNGPACRNKVFQCYRQLFEDIADVLSLKGILRVQIFDPRRLLLPKHIVRLFKAELLSWRKWLAVSDRVKHIQSNERGLWRKKMIIHFLTLSSFFLRAKSQALFLRWDCAAWWKTDLKQKQHYIKTNFFFTDGTLGLCSLVCSALNRHFLVSLFDNDCSILAGDEGNPFPHSIFSRNGQLGWRSLRHRKQQT